MGDLIIREPLASRIRQLAAREQRSVEALLNEYLEQADLTDDRQTVEPPRPDYPPEYDPDYPPRPRESLTDDLIDVPDDIADKDAYREAARKLRPKLYEKARAYWRKVGDQEKLALSDEQLDKTFWLFDHEGMPRFLWEKAIYTPPPDPLEAFVGLFADSDETDLSISVRETMAKKYGSSD